ncbi:uncharacterized protein [Physcomitrium patens]|uniref:Uncharacterized protein n=1 Tax=Physcomitrium patens TaxID=3218 RepID=A0A2K1L3S5_PHYPA|nr:uncharacterized protein LOC112278843 [Physcomitrium patens]PNR60689.1 hypothetical protein PHYPA_003482 [Physcomitrium patens]|eukprot:XP_024368458.1 uncharacterized protein LOC112278843 [Physcomitrella patens]
MGSYQLSLQGSHSTRPEASHKKSGGSTSGSSDGSRGSSSGSKPRSSNCSSQGSSAHSSQRASRSSGKKTSQAKGVHGLSFFGTKRTVSHQNLEGLLNASPSRHSTACCDGVSERRDFEKRLSSQRLNAEITSQEENSVGHSFRSEDSESLALWEEKEQPTSTHHGWLKITTQPPRWFEVVRKLDNVKLAPWRSSPIHPKPSVDSPRSSLERRGSIRHVHDSSKPWYSNVTKKTYTGESRSIWSPVSTSNESSQSGELDPALMPSYKYLDDPTISDDSKHGSFSRGREMHLSPEKNKSCTPSSNMWDASSQPELAGEGTIVAHGVAQEIPGVESDCEVANVGELSSIFEQKPALYTDKAANAFTDSPSDGIDGRSEYASCRTTTEDEAHDSDFLGDNMDPNEAIGFVNMIDFVAPLISKLHTMERKDESPSCGSERIPFKWEAPQGKVKVEDISASSLEPDESLHYRILQQQYIAKSKSAPLDDVYVLFPNPCSVSATENISDSILTKSKSYSGSRGSLLRFSSRRRVEDSADRLFTNTRNSMFGSIRPTTLGKEDIGDFVNSSSPRSILRGPDDGSLSSSNPSLRSDPGTPASSAKAASTSQSISSCSASFDLNEDDCKALNTAYDLNSTVACIIVESRRVSLSFRDFGPARPSHDDLINTDTTTEASNIDLLGCDDRFDVNSSCALPDVVQSPELWHATFSARLHSDDSEPNSRCLATECESLLSASPRNHRQFSEEECCMPSAAQKSRSRDDEFTARLGVMFSPLRLISSDDSNHSCIVATGVSAINDNDLGDGSSAYATSWELVSPAAASKQCKSKGSDAEKGKSHSGLRRHSSEEAHAMMVSITKAMRKIVSKCTGRRSSSKGKSKMGSPKCDTLQPAQFRFTEAN